jgi:DnaJ-class molecular chaperone
MAKNNLQEIGGKRREPSEKIRTGRRFDPEKYRMVVCPCCKGSGRLVKNPNGMDEVCPECGGFGHLKKKS